MILDEKALIRAALGDLVIDIPYDADDDVDEAALMEEIATGSIGVTLSDAIIEERQKGP